MKTVKILATMLLFVLIIWFSSFIKCELLTSFYGEYFNSIYKENTMFGDIEYLKVLKYSNKTARVYYVSHDYLSGDILVFSKKNGEWEYDYWEKTVWAKYGSADGFVWPYIR